MEPHVLFIDPLCVRSPVRSPVSGSGGRKCGAGALSQASQDDKILKSSNVLKNKKMFFKTITWVRLEKTAGVMIRHWKSDGKYMGAVSTSSIAVVVTHPAPDSKP